MHLFQPRANTSHQGTVILVGFENTGVFAGRSDSGILAEHHHFCPIATVVAIFPTYPARSLGIAVDDDCPALNRSVDVNFVGLTITVQQVLQIQSLLDAASDYSLQNERALRRRPLD